MPEGGDITFSTDVVALDEDHCRNQPYEIKPGRYVRISVADNGVGMDRATQERIFEPFFTTKDKRIGTGMGLSVVFGAVRNHNGWIGVESRPGAGSVFRVCLPLREPVLRPVTAARETGETAAPSAQARILLVDDEESVRKMAAIVLRKLGYEVVACRDGEEAVARFREHARDIDLVILDMALPQMGGDETFRALRDVDPDVRVVIASGFGIDGTVQQILDAGAMGFIQKPFAMKELSDRVRQALAGQRQSQSGTSFQP
jgi:CheY-like chemotaxis protein